MKKIAIMALSFALLASSCSNNTGTGTAAGAQFGSIIGSAIGGLTGGRYGRDLGTVIGMAGGAAAGAAIGSAADKKQKRQMEEYKQEAYDQYQQQQGQYPQERQYPQQGQYPRQQGDDRIDFDAPGPRESDAARAPGATRNDNWQGSIIEQLSPDTSVEIRNVRFVTGAQDGIIRSGEQCQLVFEIMNLSGETIRDVRPTVTDLTNNKYLHISPNLLIESIAPHSGVRYTANIMADKKLKDGEAVIRVSVNHGELEVSTQTQEFTVTTCRNK